MYDTSILHHDNVIRTSSSQASHNVLTCRVLGSHNHAACKEHALLSTMGTPGHSLKTAPCHVNLYHPSAPSPSSSAFVPCSSVTIPIASLAPDATARQTMPFSPRANDVDSPTMGSHHRQVLSTSPSRPQHSQSSSNHSFRARARRDHPPCAFMNTRWGRDEYDGLHVYDPVYPNRCTLSFPPSPTSLAFSDGYSGGESEEDAERSSLGEDFPRYFSRNATQEMMEFLEAPGDEFAVETSDDTNTLVAEDGDTVLSCEYCVSDEASPSRRQCDQSLFLSAEPASSNPHDASRDRTSPYSSFIRESKSKSKADEIYNKTTDYRLKHDFYPMPGISAPTAPGGSHPYSFASRSSRLKEQKADFGRMKAASGAPLRPLRRSQPHQGSSSSNGAVNGGITGFFYSPPRQADIDRYANKPLPSLSQPARSARDKVPETPAGAASSRKDVRFTDETRSTPYPTVSEGVSGSMPTAGNKSMHFVKPRSAPAPPIRLSSLKSIGSGGLLKRRLLRREHRNLSADVKAL